MEEKTVRQVLQEFRKESGDSFGEGPIVTIRKNRSTTYIGTASYFMFNGAYTNLCNKIPKIVDYKNNIIIL